MKTIWEKINNTRLHIKIILIIFMCSLVLIITEVESRQMVYRVYDEQLYLRTAQVLTSYINQVEMEFDRMDNVTLSIIGDSGIQNNLMILRDGQEADRLTAINNLESLLSGFEDLRDNRDLLNEKLGIRLVDGEFVGTKLMTDARLDELCLKARKARGSLVLVSEGEYIWVIRQIRQTKNMTFEELGTIICRLDMNALIRGVNESYKKLDIEPNLTIVTKDGYIYSTDIHTQEGISLSGQNGWSVVENQFVVQVDSRDLGWIFCCTISYEKIQQTVQTTAYKSILITILVSCIAIIICNFIIRSIIAHIDVLLDKFDYFSGGILPDKELSKKYQKRKDEIGKLHNQFDKMAEDYKRMSDEHYNSMLLVKEAQFDQLQKQIRPHFLFNTLSTIVWNAYDKGDDETARMADALGELLRYSISHKEKVNTVREEMKAVEDYIYIQQIRYANRFTMEVNLSEELQEVRVPSFTLQPIVENIIVHVVEKSYMVCSIRIYGRIEDETAEIVVEDSGNLLDPEILCKIDSGEKVARGNGVGLTNINNRIKLLYSDAYGLKLERAEGYSRVIVRVPGGMIYDKGNVGG